MLVLSTALRLAQEQVALAWGPCLRGFPNRLLEAAGEQHTVKKARQSVDPTGNNKADSPDDLDDNDDEDDEQSDENSATGSDYYIF